MLFCLSVSADLVVTRGEDIQTLTATVEVFAFEVEY